MKDKKVKIRGSRKGMKPKTERGGSCFRGKHERMEMREVRGKGEVLK